MCEALLSYHTTAKGCGTERPEFNESRCSRIKSSMAKPYAVTDSCSAVPAESLIDASFEYLGVGRRLRRMLRFDENSRAGYNVAGEKY